MKNFKTILNWSVLTVCLATTMACDDQTDLLEMEGDIADRDIYHGEPSSEPTVIKITTQYGSCSGTAISQRVALTAGHCFGSLNFVNDSASLWVTFTFPNGSTDTTYCDIERYPGYNGVGYRDLALVKTTRTTFNNVARIWDDEVYTGMRLDIFGYGNIYNSGYPNPGTQHTGDNFAQIRVDKRYDTYFRSKGRTARTCTGDSGGPASRMTDLNGVMRPAVVGVISGASLTGECTTEGKNMTFPRVAPRMDWVESRGFLDCRRKNAGNGYVQVCTDVIAKDPGIVTLVNPAGYTVNRHKDENKNGGTINLWETNYNISQDWVFATDNTIRSLTNLGYCLNIHYNDVKNGSIINLWECNGHDSQQWTRSGNTVRPRKNTGYCLNLHNYNNTNGGTINLWQCNGHASQTWYYQ